MTFNIFVTQGVSCFGQDDRIHDLIPPDLRSNKRPIFWQLLVNEFHFPAVFKCFDPLLVWHVRGTSGEATVARKYTSFSEQDYGRRTGGVQAPALRSEITNVEIRAMTPKTSVFRTVEADPYLVSLQRRIASDLGGYCGQLQGCREATATFPVCRPLVQNPRTLLHDCSLK